MSTGTTARQTFEWIDAATVKHPRTENQVKDAVRQLSKKLRARNSYRGHELTLYTHTVTMGQGTIQIQWVEPDRTMQDRPATVLAAVELDQDATAVELYRAGQRAYSLALHRSINFQLGFTDPAKHDMRAAWRLLVTLHGDAGHPGHRREWTDREVLEWIRDNHVRPLEALASIETAPTGIESQR